MAPSIRGRSGAQRAMQSTNPVRPGQPAGQIPGPTATRTVINDGNLVYTPSPMDKKVREIENTIGQFVPDFIKDFGRQQEKKGFAEALLPGAVMTAPSAAAGLTGVASKIVGGQVAGKVAPKLAPNQTALDISQTPTAVEPRRFADLRGSATPGSNTPAATNAGEAKAMASAESSRPGTGYPAGVDKPMDYAPVAGTGGGMTAGAPTPNMTYDAFMKNIGKGNQELADATGRTGRAADIRVRNPFESTNLPGTAKAEGEVELPKNGNEGEGANLVKANEDDSRAVNLDPTESEGSVARRRASQAFLDTNMNSMRALRAAEGEMGLISQGGRKFMRDPNAEGGLTEITRDQYRARMDGGDIEAIFGENKAGAGPVAEISAKPTGYKANASLKSGMKAESDAYIPPSDSQNPIPANSDHTPIDGEAQVKMKASNLAQARLRSSFR